MIEPAGAADLGPGEDAFVEADVAPALGLAGATTTANGAEAEPEVMDGAVAGAVAPIQESMSGSAGRRCWGGWQCGACC